MAILAPSTQLYGIFIAPSKKIFIHALDEKKVIQMFFKDIGTPLKPY